MAVRRRIEKISILHIRDDFFCQGIQNRFAYARSRRGHMHVNIPA